ncbi:unnamed protein product [Malus baccata var. baccata]
MEPLTTVRRPTHRWKVVMRTPELKLYTLFDKAVEYGGTRWEHIKFKVKSRESDPKWERKKTKKWMHGRGKIVGRRKWRSEKEVF